MAFEKEQSFMMTKKTIAVVLGSVSLVGVVIVCVTTLVPDRYTTTADGAGLADDLKWWQTTIVYQIYPRSFQDSDGDGTGDLQGIISRLSHFEYLGVEAIWLSPFYASPMRDFGYDISDYRQVDPIFGTMTDLENLVAEAHNKGIKIIVDFVPNHTSNDSKWFQNSRDVANGGQYKDYYIWHPGKINADGTRAPPNDWLSGFGGPAWQWDPKRGEYYYHNYLSSQPDLNYNNPHVLHEMDGVLRFWLDKGIDGFRIDAITHLFEDPDLTLPHTPRRPYASNQPQIFDVVRRWRRILDEYETDGNIRFMLPETPGISHADRMRYYETGTVPFFYDLIPAKETCGATTKCFMEIIQKGLNLQEGQWPNFVIGNHDNPRVADRLGEDYVDAMNMLLLTLPGTPTTYYGEELGMRGGNYTGLPPQDPKAITLNNINMSRDSERNPMQWNTDYNAGFTTGRPWLPLTPNTDYQHVNVQTEKLNPNSSINIYKTLAKLRQRPAFRSTSIKLQSTNNILSYERWDASERYVVALNLGTTHDNIALDNKCTSGHVMAATTGGHADIVLLSDVHLGKGEGIIVRLIE